PLSARRRAKGTVGGVLLPWDAIVSQGAGTGLSVGSSRAATPWSPVFVQVRTGYPTYPTRRQHEGDGKRAGQSTKSLKSPIAPCHCIHVEDSETSPPIHTYISFPTRDIVTSGEYVGFCLLTCTFMVCARGGPCWHESPKTQPDLHRWPVRPCWISGLRAGPRALPAGPGDRACAHISHGNAPQSPARQRRRREKQREATSGASCERVAPPTSRNMNTPDPHAPADTPAHADIA